MNPITPGYKYDLANRGGSGIQVLQFEQREPSQFVTNGPRALTTVEDGTTTEEVLAALLHRTIHLNQLLPCPDNFLIAHHLELALTLLNNRTADRMKRGVEGTAQQ